ncbi:MAG: hypothetical protein FJ100_14765 [Deltaproteobacteria bacterium]|nr:hypothetical protein [Deltaproteobacteria bacterium]
MNDDNTVDFLATADDPTDDAQHQRAAVEAVRGAMIDWAARALAGRTLRASVYRGAKGVAQCRLDLDRHLKFLLAGSDDPAERDLAQYRQWALAAIWLPRGSTPDEFDAGAHVLAESLVRFVAWPHGPRLAARVAEMAGGCDPQVQSAIAQRRTSG